MQNRDIKKQQETLQLLPPISILPNLPTEEPNYDTARLRMSKPLTLVAKEGRETKKLITWLVFFKGTGKQNRREKQNSEAQEGREKFLRYNWLILGSNYQFR